MPSGERDRDAVKFGTRDWGEISDAWSNFIPTFDEGIEWPQEEVEDLPQLRPIYDYLRKSRTGEMLELEEVNFIYPEVFRAALAYLRRATHVVRAVASHSGHGFRSWSRVSAYQSAFFGMQSILRLLGAAILLDRQGNQTFQLDLWAQSEHSKNLIASSAEAFSVKGAYRCDRSIVHYQHWSLFARLVRATSVSPAIWPYSVGDRFKMVPGDVFAVVRNKMEYRASYWPFEDLVAPLPAENFAERCREAAEKDWTEDPYHGDFPLLLGLQVVVMSLALFKSLASEGSRLSDELNAREHDLAQVHVTLATALGIQ